jgi:pimeloyl-ACP methyl ester carboxylesterase
MSAARTDRIVVGTDISIVVHLDGAAAARGFPDVVVLPSYGRDGGEDFDAFASELAAAGHRVLRPQPRGIAGSTGPMRDVTMEDLAADVATVIERLDAAPAVVVGHAFGNFVARVLAVNHPTLVDRVVLAAASGHNVDPVVNSAPFRAGDPTLPESERLEALRLAFFAPGHDASIWLSGWYPEALATQHAAVKRLEPARYWTAGDTPILEIIAEHDPFHIRSEWDDLRREAGDRVSTVVIDGASHALFPEQPAAVAAAVLTYLH